VFAQKQTRAIDPGKRFEKIGFVGAERDRAKKIARSLGSLAGKQEEIHCPSPLDRLHSVAAVEKTLLFDESKQKETKMTAADKRNWGSSLL
jgi:hypothetical protein